jgi:DNA-binding protein YbaB
MFDKLKAAAGVAGLLKDLPRVQARLLEVKEELGRVQCAGHSPCRRVRAVMNGRLELVSVDIDPESMVAIRHARREAGQHVAAAAQELGLPIPPGLLQHL